MGFANFLNMVVQRLYWAGELERLNHGDVWRNDMCLRIIFLAVGFQRSYQILGEKCNNSVHVSSILPYFNAPIIA
jgi:hypothetical protein